MRKLKVIKLIQDTFCRCEICAAVVMRENINMHKDWHKATEKELT